MRKLSLLISILFAFLLMACNTVPKDKSLDRNKADTVQYSIENDSIEARAIIHQAPNQAEIDSLKAEKFKKKKKGN